MSGPVISQLEKVAEKGLGKVISNTFCKNFAKKAAETAAEEVLSSSVTGVAGLFVKVCVRMVQTLIYSFSQNASRTLVRLKTGLKAICSKQTVSIIKNSYVIFSTLTRLACEMKNLIPSL